ncbi:MAG: hypothetical protein AAGI38_16070 [Bacteroidota bacterium]
MKYKHIYLLGMAILLISSGCDGFFGKRTPIDFLDEPVFDERQVAYVPIQPVISEGLVRPIDVVPGYDELVYVVDEATEEIISYDQAGIEQGRFQVQGVKAIVQDRRLDILAAGTFDTLISGTTFRLPAIYRIDLDPAGTYGLQNARIQNKIIHPFYFRTGTPTTSDEAVSFEGIAVTADNRFYVSRNGPNNSPGQFLGPDDAVLFFNDADEFLTPITVSTGVGNFTDFFNMPKALTGFAQPPQSPAVSRDNSFIFTSVAPNQVLKVQTIQVEATEFGTVYSVRNYQTGDTSRADRFLYEADRFGLPSDVTVAGDGTNYIFVTDAEKDSLFVFNGQGFEGVAPPPGSASTKVILASFGGTGESLTQFREPAGVAYLNEIVYVADAGNGRLLRFRLTTDFD